MWDSSPLYFVPSYDAWREIKANVPCLAWRRAGWTHRPDQYRRRWHRGFSQGHDQRQHTNVFTHVAARDLILWKCSGLPDVKNLERTLKTLQFDGSDDHLVRLTSARRQISQHFGDKNLSKEPIHILVEVPPLGEYGTCIYCSMLKGFVLSVQPCQGEHAYLLRMFWWANTNSSEINDHTRSEDKGENEKHEDHDKITEFAILWSAYFLHMPKSERTAAVPLSFIVIAGASIATLGAIWTDKIIVQRLTDYIWLGHDTIFNDETIYRNARILHALARSLRRLNVFYQYLEIHSQPANPKMLEPEPR